MDFLLRRAKLATLSCNYRKTPCRTYSRSRYIDAHCSESVCLSSIHKLKKKTRQSNITLLLLQQSVVQRQFCLSSSLDNLGAILSHTVRLLVVTQCVKQMLNNLSNWCHSHSAIKCRFHIHVKVYIIRHKAGEKLAKNAAGLNDWLQLLLLYCTKSVCIEYKIDKQQMQCHQHRMHVLYCFVPLLWLNFVTRYLYLFNTFNYIYILLEISTFVT